MFITENYYKAFKVVELVYASKAGYPHFSLGRDISMKTSLN
jgi:hypothetical protein